MRPSEEELADHWMTSARRPEVSGAIRGVYAETAGEIARRAPACWASGRCCNFEKAGHLLYVTGLEAAYAIAGIDELGIRKRLEQAEGADSGRGVELVQIGAAADVPGSPVSLKGLLGAAPGKPGCPFQSANLCSIHVVKPLACRTYFCDRTAGEWQNELSERMHARIRAIHDERGVEYRYGEWREMLCRFGAARAG